MKIKKLNELNNQENNLQKVHPVQDDNGHWFILPNEFEEEFENDLLDEDFVDSGEFDDKYRKYKTGGALNNVQLYAKFDSTKQRWL
jgi:hypothetical protein